MGSKSFSYDERFNSKIWDNTRNAREGKVSIFHGSFDVVFIPLEAAFSREQGVSF